MTIKSKSRISPQLKSTKQSTVSNQRANKLNNLDIILIIALIIPFIPP